MYVLSTDSIVTNIQFNGIMPYEFNIAANSTGPRTTSNPASDRQSQIGNINFPDYKIFLNDPDSICFPSYVFIRLLVHPSM